MNGLADYVAATQPWLLPRNPVAPPWANGVSMGEFVLATDPWLFPRNPIAVSSAHGSLPKAPPIPMALIGNGNGANLDDGCGCGAGCGCADCGGMGALDLTTIQNLIPGQTFGISNTYLVGGALLAFLLFSASKRGRR